MDLPEAQGSRHARESKSGIPEIVLPVEFGILEILMEEFGILGFGIRNPWRGIQNTGLSWIPLFRATRRALTTDARRNWNSLMTYFIYLGSVISNEDGSRRDNNKVSTGKVWRVFSNNTASRLKSNCITAVRVNKLVAFIRQEY